MMFDTETLNKLLSIQKKVISGFEWHWEEMQKKGQYFSKKLTVEGLERLWALEDTLWEDFKESLDKALKTTKETISTHEYIDQLINNNQRVKELQQRERKRMLWKIQIKNKQRMEKKKNKDKDKEREDKAKEKGKAANENTSSNLDEGAKDDSGKTKTATKDLAGLQCNEMKVSQEKIINKSSTEIVPSVAEGDTEQLDDPSEHQTVDKEVHEDNVSTVAPKRKRGRPPKLQAKIPGTPLTASHENEGVDPSAASVVESAQMKEVSSPISINTESPVQDYQDESNEKAGENMETRKTDEMHSPIPIHSPMDIVSDDQPCSRWIDGMHSPIPIHSPDIQDASKEKTDGSLETKDPEASAVQSVDLDDQPLATWIEGVHSPVPFNGPAPVGTSTKSERQLEIVACDIDADIPFVKTTPLWHTIESMEAFRKLPQNPHFRPLLKGVKESAREGLAIGTMVTFSTVVDRTYCLRSDDPRSAIEDALETLVDLESNGFDVEAIRERLTRLLLIKDKQEELEDQSKVFVEKIEEQKIPEKTFDDELDEIDRQIRQLEEKRSKVLLKKENSSLEVGALKASKEAIEQELLEVGAEFDGLAAAPF